MRSRFVATFLSFIFPGLGQLYNDQTTKALGFAGLQAPTLLLAGLTDAPLSMIFMIGGMFGLWAAWDAYTVAARRDFYRAFE